jgi:N-hydroxyarylamine O-acetyltransferase
VNVHDYLNRINHSTPIFPEANTLRDLHRDHMFNVPFENLDIRLGRTIFLDAAVLWDKIVTHRRGGFCYELNGLFAAFLMEIGFDVTYLNARVFKPGGIPGIDFGHLALLVRAPGQTGHWLADVGFGDSFTEPLRFEQRGEQAQGLRAYRLEETGGAYNLWQRGYDGTWKRQYCFDLKPRNFPGDYAGGCQYHQTSPQSSLTKGDVISMATPDGRVTLEQTRLIVTRDGKRAEKPVADGLEYSALLKEYFGVIP